jgi:hypothetical protein
MAHELVIHGNWCTMYMLLFFILFLLDPSVCHKFRVFGVMLKLLF